jgi:hypothetical protein
MVNRQYLLKQLQKPSKGLRKRIQRNTSESRSSPQGFAGVGGNLAASDFVRTTAGEGMSFTARPSMDETNPMDSE